MSLPSVAVIVTTHNRPLLLRRALQSVLAQTHAPDEVHVVDDGSEPEAAAAVREHCAAVGVPLWRHPQAKRVGAARNTGLRHSSSEMLAFLDDDDEWKPECLEKRLLAFGRLTPGEREQTGVVYCGGENHLLDEGRITRISPRVRGDIRAAVCRNELFTIPSANLYTRAALERVGGYDEKLTSSLIHDLWMGLAVHGYRALPIDEPLVITRLASSHRSMVNDTQPRIRGVEQYLEKWGPTLEEWLGPKPGRRYVRHYRIRVLGGLAALKLCQGDLRATGQLVGHLAARNRCSPPDMTRLGWLLLRRLLRSTVPTPWLDRLAGRQGAQP